MIMNIKYLLWQFIIYCRLPRILKKINGREILKYHLLSSASLLMPGEIKRETNNKNANNIGCTIKLALYIKSCKRQTKHLILLRTEMPHCH